MVTPELLLEFSRGSWREWRRCTPAPNRELMGNSADRSSAFKKWIANPVNCGLRAKLIEINNLIWRG